MSGTAQTVAATAEGKMETSFSEELSLQDLSSIYAAACLRYGHPSNARSYSNMVS